MNDYYCLRFDMNPCEEIETDILASLLCDVGFESFEPDGNGVSAYVKKEIYDMAAVNEAILQYPFHAKFDIKEIFVEGQDWNSEWEKNYFKPVVFDDMCVVHSSFHHDYQKAKYDIVIDPKMAFGTGHHETTSLMMHRILSSEMEGKKVLDMGTGTGILAILSAMAGASVVVGVEIDPPAYDNAKDNVVLNGQSQVEIRLGGVETVYESDYFDIVLANINRNIILGDIENYAKALKHGGRIFLSGFYVEDVDMITKAASKCGLEAESVIERNRWANICLVKK